MTSPKPSSTTSPQDAPPRPARRTLFAAAWQRMFAQGDGPPDLDELWKDFNRKLSGLFGGKSGGSGGGDSSGGGPGFQPDV